MKHLASTAAAAAESFPVIEEEGNPAPTVTQRPHSNSSHPHERDSGQSFTTIASDEIVPALSNEENSSDDEPLIKRRLVPAPPVIYTKQNPMK